MSLALALALAAGSDLSSARPAISAFDKVCAAAASIDDAAARAAADGWTEFEPAKASPLGYVVSLTRAMGGPKGDRAFRRDGDSLFVWTRETIPAAAGQFVECRVYDFDVKTLPSEEALNAWAGRKPDHSFNFDDGQSRLWLSYDGSKSTSVSVQTPPCLANPCPQPRLVIERSVSKNP